MWISNFTFNPLRILWRKILLYYDIFRIIINLRNIKI